MRSFKTFAILIVSLCIVIAVLVQGKKLKKGSPWRFGSNSWSLSRSDFYFYAYSFNQESWPDTPYTMEEFGNNSVTIMWANKPANMSAAICIQGSWSAKNYELISATIRTSYFKKTWLGFTTCEVRK